MQPRRRAGRGGRSDASCAIGRRNHAQGGGRHRFERRLRCKARSRPVAPFGQIAGGMSASSTESRASAARRSPRRASAAASAAEAFQSASPRVRILITDPRSDTTDPHIPVLASSAGGVSPSDAAAASSSTASPCALAMPRSAWRASSGSPGASGTRRLRPRQARPCTELRRQTSTGDRRARLRVRRLCPARSEAAAGRRRLKLRDGLFQRLEPGGKGGIGAGCRRSERVLQRFECRFGW